MDSPEIENELGNRPTAEIIAEISRDLGLEAEWEGRPFRRPRPLDIQRLCEHAAAPHGVPRVKPTAEPPSHPTADPLPDDQPKRPIPPNLDGKGPAEIVAASLRFAADTANSKRDPRL